MIVFPNAKINLGLNITEKRPDGFHNLETLFYPVKWCDILEVVPAAGSTTTITQTGIAVDVAPEKNLVMRAYTLLAASYPIPPVDIYLHKIIPFGAGLGGGSADAAQMLVLLNRMFNLAIDDATLASYAAQLGSDCPFFVYNQPMMATGRGEILSTVDFSLDGYHILLVKPPFGISTPEAFAGIKPQKPAISISDVIAKPIEEWRSLLKNDFEEHLFVKYPLLSEIKQQLYDAGATYAAMSGSGSTIFGIFKNKCEVAFEDCTAFWAEL